MKKVAKTKRRQKLKFRPRNPMKWSLLIMVLVFGAYGVYALISAGATGSNTTKLRIASYNILVGYRQDLVDHIGSPFSIKQRSERVAALVTDKSFDVFGVQEMGKNQFNYIRGSLKERGAAYSYFPKEYYGKRKTTRYSQRTIFWKTDRFQLVESGSFSYTGYYDSKFQLGFKSPWVKLEDRTSHIQFYVLNVHPVAHIRKDWYPKNKTDYGGALKREHTAKRMASWLTARKDSGAAMFVMGDMNSRFAPQSKDVALHGKRSRLPYCIITATGLVHHGADIANGKTGVPCPSTTNKRSSIDHIYLSTDTTTLTRYVIMPWTNSMVKWTSDHRPVYMDVMLYPDAAAKAAALSPEPPSDEPAGLIVTGPGDNTECGISPTLLCE